MKITGSNSILRPASRLFREIKPPGVIRRIKWKTSANFERNISETLKGFGAWCLSTTLTKYQTIWFSVDFIARGSCRLYPNLNHHDVLLFYSHFRDVIFISNGDSCHALAFIGRLIDRSEHLFALLTICFNYFWLDHTHWASYEFAYNPSRDSFREMTACLNKPSGHFLCCLTD